jgi:hypothetical protein
MPKWRNEYRRCDICRVEYRPHREAQSYCSRRCKRAAAYGRERFKAGTVGRRRRRLEASDKLSGRVVAGSVRNGVFSSINPRSCRPTDWIEKLNQAAANEIDRADWTAKKREWPLDLMGRARHRSPRPAFTVEPELRDTIIETEWLLRDDEPPSHPLLAEDIGLEYYEDDYPKLPPPGDPRQFGPKPHDNFSDEERSRPILPAFSFSAVSSEERTEGIDSNRRLQSSTRNTCSAAAFEALSWTI